MRSRYVITASSEREAEHAARGRATTSSCLGRNDHAAIGQRLAGTPTSLNPICEQQVAHLAGAVAAPFGRVHQQARDTPRPGAVRSSRRSGARRERRDAAGGSAAAEAASSCGRAARPSRAARSKRDGRRSRPETARKHVRSVDRHPVAEAAPAIARACDLVDRRPLEDRRTQVRMFLDDAARIDTGAAGDVEETVMWREGDRCARHREPDRARDSPSPP